MTRRAFTDCWAKLNHAKAHIELLRAEIEEVGAPAPESIPLRREYDPNERAIIYRIDRVIEVRDSWPLILGDAIHDLRGALDHLMWRLAITYLGRTPSKTEAPRIQFPQVRRLRDFQGHRFLRYVRPEDIDRLKPFQPYKRPSKGNRHPLPKLISLSNTDKHRRLHLLVVAPYQATFTNNLHACRDCVPDIRPMPNGSFANIESIAPKRSPQPGDIVLRAFVRPTGPNPDVDLEMRLSCFIGIGKLGPVIPMLEGMADYVVAVLQAFDPPT